MIVTLDNGATIALGTTETATTIAITDYSRRVTDDFGVTTVVRRGFSRRMSLRFALPFDDAGRVQVRLADLRATPAIWVADDRWRALSVRGLLKDFEVDLATPPLSYCSLSVDGLAESNVQPDPGGDPAPVGMVSALQMVRPIPVTDAVLTACNVAEDDAPAWVPTNTYPTGARVQLGHRVFESLVAGNVGNDPTGSVGKWIDIGPTNRWAMFDQALGTATSAGGSIVVTLASGTADTIALLDVEGSTVRVEAAGYDQTEAVRPSALRFAGLPGGPITVTIAGAGTVAVGTLLVGNMVALGVTAASPTAGITDYSRKEIDDFGNVQIVERAWSKRMQATALIRSDAVDTVFDRIAGVRAVPTLWIGAGTDDPLVIYGFFKDASIQVSENVSTLSLSVEGLSKAASLKPFEVRPPTWEAVTDPNGTKPDNGADVTGDNTSKDTNAVGGRPANALLATIDALNNVAIPAINAAVATANGRIVAARQDADAAVQATNGQINTVRNGLDQALVDLATEVSRAQGSEEHLSRRVDAISASAENDHAAIRAEIRSVDTARADDHRAIAARVDSIVTDYQSRDVATNGRITQSITTLSDADRALGERVDAVVTEYRGLNSSTSTRISDAVTALSDADHALGGRVDAVVAQVIGNDSAARAEIKRVEDAAADRDGAQTRRIDSLAASSDAADARISQVATAASDANNAVGNLSTSVNTRFNGVSQSLGSFDQRITTLSNEGQSYAGRAGTLEAQMSRQQQSALNQYTADVDQRLSQVNTAVNARINATEDVLADLPNRYAAASRTATLEAQLRGDVTSGLSDAIGGVNGRIDTSNSQLIARIEDRATAIADAKAGAVAQTVQQLRSEYNGTAASVSHQAGSIAALNGRTSAYVRFVAEAGDNRVQVTFAADSHSGAGVDIVGDVRINGSLIISGTITRTTIGAGEITLMQVVRSGTYYDGTSSNAVVLDYTLYVPEAAPFIFVVNGTASSYGDNTYGRLSLYVDGAEWGGDTSYSVFGNGQNLSFALPLPLLSQGNHSVQLRYAGSGTAIYYPSLGIFGAFR